MQSVVKYIEEHKDDYDYTEAIIAPNGQIQYAKIGHANELGMQSNIPFDVLYHILPMDASPASWLVDYTGCISVWPDFAYLPPVYTKEQIQTLSVLQRSKLIKKKYTLYINYEMHNAKIREDFHAGHGTLKDLKHMESLTISEARKRLKKDE